MKAVSFTRVLLAAGILLGMSLGVALANDAIATKQTSKGEVFVDGEGMSLYVFDRDTQPGKSVCNGGCAFSWPPLAADAYASANGKFSVITRDDGSRQWAVDGKPVYRWNKDKHPGDTNGDGVNGIWHLAKP